MYFISSSYLLLLSFNMLGILIVVSLARLFLRPELPDLFIKLKVSLASLNFLVNLSFPNKYLSSSKHYLKDSCLKLLEDDPYSLKLWKDCSKGFSFGAIMISSSSYLNGTILEPTDSSN